MAKKLVTGTNQPKTLVAEAPLPIARPFIGAGVGAEATGNDPERPDSLMPGLE